MRDERLIINGVAAEYTGFRTVEERDEFGVPLVALKGTERSADSSRAIQFLPLTPARRSFGPVVVPRDRYFFLGDNRDNSADSRYIGVVSRERLIGRAHHVLVSADLSNGWAPRLERFGQRIR